MNDLCIKAFRCPCCKNYTLYDVDRDVKFLHDVSPTDILVCSECASEYYASDVSLEVLNYNEQERYDAYWKHRISVNDV